jgi:hypothetical protein
MRRTPNDLATRQFTALLSATTVLPAEIHRAAWRHATAAADPELRTILLSRMDAPDDLLEQYAAVRDTAPRAAYLARPRLSGERTHVHGEKRAAVLADALTRAPNDPAVIAAAVDAFYARPSLLLADSLCLLHVNRLTPKLVEAILRIWDTSATNRSEPSRAIAAHLGTARAAVLLRELTKVSTIVSLLMFDVDDDSVRAAVLRIGPQIIRGLRSTLANGHPVYAGQHIDLLEPLVRSTNPARRAAAQALVELAGRGSREARLLESEITRLSGPAYYGYSASPFAPQTLDESRLPVHPDELSGAELDLDELSGNERRQLTATVDAVTLRILVTWTVSALEQLTRAGHAVPVLLGLLSNPHLPERDRYCLLESTRLLRNCSFAPGIGHFDALGMRPGDAHLASVWCDTFPAEVLRLHGWAPFGGPEQAARLLTSWLQRTDPWAPPAIAAALEAGIPDDALLSLPLGKIIAHLERGNAGFTPVGPTSAAVARHLVADLGDNDAAWAIYDQLAMTFTGSFGELLDLCRGASAPAT